MGAHARAAVMVHLIPQTPAPRRYRLGTRAGITAPPKQAVKDRFAECTAERGSPAQRPRGLRQSPPVDFMPFESTSWKNTSQGSYTAYQTVPSRLGDSHYRYWVIGVRISAIEDGRIGCDAFNAADAAPRGPAWRNSFAAARRFSDASGVQPLTLSIAQNRARLASTLQLLSGRSRAPSIITWKVSLFP